MVKIKKIKIYYLEHKLKKYVYTSFGVMKSRPGLIIELSDDNGNIGLGEIWCNFPSNSASYKFQLFKDIFAKNFSQTCRLLTNNIEITPVKAPRAIHAIKEVIENPAIS